MCSLYCSRVRRRMRYVAQEPLGTNGTKHDSTTFTLSLILRTTSMVMSSLSSLNDVLDQISGMLFFYKIIIKCLSDMFSTNNLENALTRLVFWVFHFQKCVFFCLTNVFKHLLIILIDSYYSLRYFLTILHEM